MFNPFTPRRRCVFLRNEEGGGRRSPSRLRDRRATVRYPVIKRNRFRHDVDGNRRSDQKFLPMLGGPRWWNPRKQRSARIVWPARSSFAYGRSYSAASIKSSVYRGNWPVECRKTRRWSELSAAAGAHALPMNSWWSLSRRDLRIQILQRDESLIKRSYKNDVPANYRYVQRPLCDILMHI